MRRRSTTVSGWRTFPSTRTAARPALLRSHPPGQGGGRGDCGGTSNGSALVIGRHRPESDYHNEHVAPALDNRSVVYRGPVAGRHAQSPGFARRCFTSSTSTNRSDYRRGGARLRHAGHRLQPRIDARAERPWRDRFLVDSVDAAVDAISRIGEIDRTACRSQYPRASGKTHGRSISGSVPTLLAEVFLGFHWPSFRCSVAVWNGTILGTGAEPGQADVRG